MFVNSKKIIKVMNEIAPEYLAENWDNVGFLIGNEDSEVDRVLIALEVTEAVVDEAIHNNIDLIICHHPLLFKPMKKITDNDPIGKMVRKLIKNDVSLYAAHTNLDIADGGTNDFIAELLELNMIKGLQNTGQDTYFKIAVFAPVENAEEVTNAMTGSGAGKMGAYSECSFVSEGRGQFRPLQGSAAHIGVVDELTKVRESKIEVIVDQMNMNRVLNAMLKAHPYEVPAYDILELKNDVKKYYLGRSGVLQSKMTLEDLAKHVQHKLNVSQLKYVGDSGKIIRKVAICTGAGADVMKDAKRSGCDVLITGDVKYHEAQTALQMNLTLIDAGHFETEQIFVSRLSDRLTRMFESKEYDVAVIESGVEENPFKSV